MSDPGNGAQRYDVRCSAAILQEIRRVHRRASRRGQGQAVTRALAEVVRRMTLDPWSLGEPAYRLSGLRMQLRTVAVRPLSVHFAVCEDRPLVFITGVRLLSTPGS